MIELITDSDREDISAFICDLWHAPHICVRHRLYLPHECEGFVVRKEGHIVGLTTFEHQNDEMLMVTLNSTEKGTGVGSSLVLRVIDEARKRQVKRLWLTTTNDNLASLGFYQKLGFRLVAVYQDAVTLARTELKPEVPEHGMNGLPIRDEIELELILEPTA